MSVGSSTLMPDALPADMIVLERGWLSSNNILLKGRYGACLVDSGYCSHSAQTLELVVLQLGGEPLDLLVNTHLHSDHCGGNSSLQSRFPAVKTLVPPGHFHAASVWDQSVLSFRETGQECPRFCVDAPLSLGKLLEMGSTSWEVHAAPGHDPDAVLLFDPVTRCLVSGDALWRNGFGVVFPALSGDDGFSEVAATLDLIESLKPLTVVPGHGGPFHEIQAALVAARSRLDAFVSRPERHALHAAKVLIKFKLLEWQCCERKGLQAWVNSTEMLMRIHRRFFHGLDIDTWFDSVMDDLIRSSVIAVQGKHVINQ